MFYKTLYISLIEIFFSSKSMLVKTVLKPYIVAAIFFFFYRFSLVLYKYKSKRQY